MAQLSSLKSVITSSEQSKDRVSILAGFGSVFGIIAAAFGLLIGKSLVPIPALNWEISSLVPFHWIVEGSTEYTTYVAIFMALLAVSLLLQARGSKNLGNFLNSGFTNVFWLGFILAIATAYIVPTAIGGIMGASVIHSFLSPVYYIGTFFVIAWQLSATIFTDSGKTWVGFFAGLLNALFIPLLAIGQAINSLLIYAAYAVLLVGQLVTLIFWLSPFSTIREYARSPEKAKFAFGLTGVLTFIIGLVAVYMGPIGEQGGIAVWYPWGTLINSTTYRTNPALVCSFLSIMLFWIMLAPRLGAHELRAAAIGEDIIKGGNKVFMLFMAIVGLMAAGQAGIYTGSVGAWGFFLAVSPAAVMFMMGASYTAKTDMLVGIPLVVTSIFLMVNPFVLLPFVIIPWFIILITQVFVMVESWWRGLTGFSQASFAVIISLASSLIVIAFLLGGFGSGPLALWPTNRWFNITLIPGIPAAIQGPVILVLPLLALLVRNVSLAGYSYGRGHAASGVLVGMSILIAIMIPAIAGNQSTAHEANTGAALLLALYSISVVLVMSLNINLANDVEEQGHDFESMFIKVATIASLVAAAVVIIVVMFVFAGTPSPEQIALMISIMVIFVVSSEMLSIVGWFIAGVRLGMLKEGFRFTRLE